MNEALIEQLKSDSLHARYGAVNALRKVGPDIIESALPLIVSGHEKDNTRLASLEAIRPFFSCVGAVGLRALSSALPTMRSPALKIELIKLLTLRRFAEAIPSVRMCVDQHEFDERIQWFGQSDEDDREGLVSTHAREFIRSVERSGGEAAATD